MSHVRQRIREAVANALLDVPEFADKVVPSRSKSVADSALPLVAVYTTLERRVDEFESLGESDPTARGLDLVIDCVVDGEDADIAMDDASVLIETRMSDASILSGLATEYHWVSTELTTQRDARKPIGKLVLTYRVFYFTDAADPTAACV